MSSVRLGAYELVGYLSGENVGDQYGSAMCTIDFNADSFPDLVVAAPASDAAGTSSGKVYIYFGGNSADTIADLTLVGAASSFFGQSLASAGDFNNDGYEDLLVGAPFYDIPASNAGAVYLFYGGPSADTTVDHIFTGENASDYYGRAVAGIGDFNNDTYDDIAIGAYKADWGSFSNSGKVYVYYGGPSPDFTADKILVGESDGERFGWAVAGGDLNGDNVSDVAVGAYSYDAYTLNQGRIYFFYGSSSPDTLFDLTITGDSAGYKFGWSLTTGRVSNDSYQDLLMGTDGFSIDTFSAGKVFAYFGGPSWDGIADYSYNLGRLAHDYLGYSIASGVDLNEDGFDEFITGMPGNDDGGADAGGAVVFASGAIAPDTSVLGNSAGEEMGEAVALWQSFGDSHTHVFAVGASAYDSFRGRIVLYRLVNAAPNQPPVLDPIGPKTITALDNLNFLVTASDPDGPPPSLLAMNVPSGATFTDHLDGTGTFDWTPALQDTGVYNVTFIASDGQLDDTEIVVITVIDTTGCCIGDRGNVNGDAGDDINVADLTYLVDFLFRGGPAPSCTEEGNVNGDTQEQINVADLTYLVDFLFRGGALPPPCP
jgi:hypothetical protein